MSRPTTLELLRRRLAEHAEGERHGGSNAGDRSATGPFGLGRRSEALA